MGKRLHKHHTLIQPISGSLVTTSDHFSSAPPNTHTHLPPFLAGPGGGSNQPPVAAALQGQPGLGNSQQNLPPLQQGPGNPQALPPQYRDQGPSNPQIILPQQQVQGGQVILPPPPQQPQPQQQQPPTVNEQIRDQQLVDNQNGQPQPRRHQQPTQGVQVSGAQSYVSQPNPQRLPSGVPNIVVNPAQSPSPQITGALVVSSPRRIQKTDVQCLKTHMLVTVRFSAPFNGYIYPHNQFSKCLLFRGDNALEAQLTLRHGTCGDQENRITYRGKSFLDPVIEHRLMVQWEREIVSEDDSSVIVRCDRPDDYNKTVEWKLGTQDIAATLERAQHPGPKMWMEIQRGEGPTAPPLGNEPVYIGDVLTLLFVLSDNVFWFDSNILSCHALDGGNEVQQIEWDTKDNTQVGHPRRDYSGQTAVIENGCSVKPKLFSHFFKERNTMPNGDLVTLQYGHFKAFRFPTSLRLVLQCNVQVCYKECPELPPCSEAFHPRQAAEQSRRRREAENRTSAKGAHEIDRVELFRTLEVLLQEEGGEKHVAVTAPVVQRALEEYCYSPTVYYSTVIGLVCLVVILIVIIAVVCLKDRMRVSSLFTPTKCSQ